MGTKTKKNKNKANDTAREKNHKKCEPKFNPKLETQRHKARTQHLLKDDSNETLFQ
jgi:hypothetical protein